MPWLDYTGQGTAEILAHKATHRIDSLLCTLEQAIQLRQSRFPDLAFAFVESRQHAFAIERMSVGLPKRGNHNLIHLGVGLNFAPKTDLTFEAVRKLAAEVAAQEEIEPSDVELDGAAYLFLFKSFLKAGEMEQCERFAEPAFDLAREDTSHCIVQKAMGTRARRKIAQVHRILSGELPGSESRRPTCPQDPEGQRQAQET